jgi:hypothetical protein
MVQGPDYWLRRCHGYEVVTSHGRVGFVEQVVFGERADIPIALDVRGGALGRRRYRVPVGAVREVRPRERRLTVAEPLDAA